MLPIIIWFYIEATRAMVSDCRYAEDINRPYNTSSAVAKYTSYNIEFMDGTHVSGVATGQDVPVYYQKKHLIIKFQFVCQNQDYVLNFTYYNYLISKYSCRRLSKCPPDTTTPTSTNTKTPVSTKTSTSTKTSPDSVISAIIVIPSRATTGPQTTVYRIPIPNKNIQTIENSESTSKGEGRSPSSYYLFFLLLMLVPVCLVLIIASAFLGLVIYRHNARV